MGKQAKVELMGDLTSKSGAYRMKAIASIKSLRKKFGLRRYDGFSNEMIVLVQKFDRNSSFIDAKCDRKGSINGASEGYSLSEELIQKRRVENERIESGLDLI